MRTIISQTCAACILAAALMVLAAPAASFADDMPGSMQPPPPAAVDDQADDQAMAPADYVAPPAANMPAPGSMPAPALAPAPDTTHTLGTLNKAETPVPPPPGQDGSMQPITSGNVTYITGGIGNDERDALKATEKKYNLHILISTKDGHFVADTRIVIRDAKGNVLVDADAGPIFYASLPAGKYAVEVFHDGKSQKENDVKVGKDGTDNQKSYFAFTW